MQKIGSARKSSSQIINQQSYIYSYYKNKEALFDTVLSPVMYDWKRVVTAEDEAHTEEIRGLSRAELECMTHLFEHCREFFILMDKSAGTKYENEKVRLAEAIEVHLSGHRKKYR